MEYCLLQLIVHLNVFQEIFQDGAVKILHHVLPHALAPVHDDLRAVDQFKGRTCRLRIISHPNAHCNVHAGLIAEDELLPCPVLDHFMEMLRRVRPGRVVDTDAEHIIAQMAGKYLLVRQLLQKCPKHLDDLVPRDHPHPVIDLFKIIDINDHDCDDIVILLRLDHIIMKHRHKIITVIKPGHGIIMSHVHQFIMLCLDLRGVLHHDEFILRVSHIVIIHCRPKRIPASLPFPPTFHGRDTFS